MAVLAQPFDLQSPLTEIDMLRAQQREKSAEIMALKNELDNRRCRLQTMEKVHEELNAFKIDAEKQKMVRAADILAMEKDFQQLSKRHDRLMNVKDSVKEKNRLLEERISQMSVENPTKLSKVLKEKSLLVQQLNKSVAKTKLKLKNLETVYSQKLFEVENNSELERAKLLQSVHTRTKYELKKKIDSAKTEMEVNQKALKEAVMERKKNEEENFRRRDLLIKQRAQEWKTDKEANIKELKKQLATLKMAQHEAAKAFLAFKDHTNHLINRERTLNRKFSEINGKYTSSSYQ
ncbi:Hypothetical predicted protein [Octopus vulgaris]|uniref:Uncharacterized protein n=1 Tax=Octopus vulgaris TaxID=6645 RepID=A0AA36BW30_OCTVU|nr:Hypothetical predicted protein [Octopus vulgaris]